MSKDIQLTWNCPHIILEEVITLGLEGRALITKMPIATQGFVGVTINNSVSIPSGGLFSFAHLSSFLKGPYFIIENEEDLTIYTSAEAITVNLPSGTLLTAQDIATVINAASTTETTRAVSNNNRLQIWDRNLGGGGSYVEVTGRSVGRLGFKQQGATGKMLYPGWSLYSPPNMLNERWIRFNEPLNRIYDTFKVSYITTQSQCLRCKAIGIENDYRYTKAQSAIESSGDLVLIDKENLLYQSALKMLLTKQGSNPFHAEYGSTILSRVGSKSAGQVAAAIKTDVQRALKLLKGIQGKQGKYQEITLREKLHSIDTVQVVPVVDDPTTFLVQVWVRNASRQSVQLDVVFATAGSVATVVNNRTGNTLTTSGVR